MLNSGVAELAKSFGGSDELTEIYLLKSPKAYAASATFDRKSPFFWKKIFHLGLGQSRLYECQEDTPPRR